MQEIFYSSFRHAVLFFQTYIIFWIVITVLEYFSPADRNQKIFSKHSFNELINALIIAVFLWPMNHSIEHFFVDRFFQPYLPYQVLSDFVQKSTYVVQVILALLIMDMAQYIRHRMMHSGIFWPFHATHHSAIELRSTTHFRFHPVDYLISIFFKVLFLFVLGFDGAAVQMAVTILVFNSMWKHANIDFDYGPLRKVLVSPNYHKWHHSTHEEAFNKNFADIFPVLDLIGGTYHFPKNQLPDSYGVAGEHRESAVHQSYLGTLFYPLTKYIRRDK